MSKSSDLDAVEVPLLLKQQARILFGLTGRQVLVLMGGLAIGFSFWQSVEAFQSVPGTVLLACFCLGPAALIAFVQIGGKPLEHWLFIVLAWMLTPEHLTQAALERFFIKVQGIEGSVVALDLGGRSGQHLYQSVLCVESRSFELLGTGEQATIIQAFKKVLDGLSFPITIHMRALPTRPAVLSSTLIPAHLAGPLRRCYAHYLSFLSNIVQKVRPVRVSYYIIIPAEQQPAKQQDAAERAKGQLASRVQELSRQLARVGLACRPLSSAELFTFHREAFLPLPQERLTTPLPDTILRDASQLPAILAPHEIAMTQRWLEVEGPNSKGGMQYLTCLAIEQLPRKMHHGWLYQVLALNEPYIDISLYIVPQESDVIATSLRRRAVMMGGALLAAKQQGQGDEPGGGNTITRYALKDIERVRDQLVRQDGHLYAVTLLCLVRASSRKELTARLHRVQLALRSMDFQTTPLRFQQHLAFFSSLGYGQNLLAHYSHLLTNDALATFYPFTASPAMDEGVLLGTTANKSLVSFDPYGAGKLNANLAVLGVPGSGKSFFLKVILSRLAPNVAISIIDVEDEYTRFVQAIGGQRIELTADSLRINPLEIRARQGDQEGGKEHAFREKVAMLLGFFALLVGEQGTLTQYESGLLHQSIMRTYAAAGITADPATHARTVPSIQDLAAVLKQVETPGRNDLSLRLSPYLHLFPKRSQVPSVQHIVYGLKQLPEALQPAATYLITEKLWGELQAGRQVGTPGGAPRHLVVVDEAWFLSKFAAGSALLNEFARRIRKYSGGLWLGTQQLADLLTSEQGKNLLALCETKMLFRQDVSSGDAIREALHLSEEQAIYLRTARRGEALYMSSSDTLAVEILASEQEAAMAMTTQQRQGGK
jgi:PrgI family protein/Helicase HerA, central domain/AAA-like domain